MNADGCVCCLLIKTAKLCTSVCQWIYAHWRTHLFSLGSSWFHLLPTMMNHTRKLQYSLLSLSHCTCNGLYMCIIVQLGRVYRFFRERVHIVRSWMKDTQNVNNVFFLPFFSALLLSIISLYLFSTILLVSINQ